MNTEEDAQTPHLLQAGIAATGLIADPKSWINRRVETTDILSQEETRRRVSIDLTLSDEQLEELLIPDGVAVPISVLTKEARRNFDIRDEAGRAIPVLGRQQNGVLAHIALLNAAIQAGPDPLPEDVSETLAADLREVATAPRAAAEDALGGLIGAAEGGDQWRAQILEDPTCTSLLDVLWANYVLFAVLPPGGPNRRVLKFSYGDDFDFRFHRLPFKSRIAPRELARRVWRPDRRQFLIESPGAWRSVSFHAEVAIPEELRFELAVLFDFEADEQLSEADAGVNRAALYASDELGAERSVTAFLEIAPERTGPTFQAAITSIVVAVLLWLGVASGLDAQNPGAAVSILLAGAALFSGVTAAQGEHRLVKRVFAASRRWLALVSAAALASSATLAMEIPNEHPTAVWEISAIACTVAATRLGWAAIRAPA